jgi:hypothetical protein
MAKKVNIDLHKYFMAVFFMVMVALFLIVTFIH